MIIVRSKELENRRPVIYNFILVFISIFISLLTRYIITLSRMNYRYIGIRSDGQCKIYTIIIFFAEFVPLILYTWFAAVKRSDSRRVRNIIICVISISFVPLLLANSITLAFPFCSQTTNPLHFGQYDQNASVVDEFPTAIPSSATDITYEYSHALYTIVRCRWVLPEDQFERLANQIKVLYSEENGKYGYTESSKHFWVALDDDCNAVSYESYVFL